jgi:GMP synthase (glutamine-hydrolysing)
VTAMRLLAVVHGEEVRSGVFADPIAERGHELEEWSIARSPAPARALEAYDAVLVFGGSMHADEDESHPWLRDEEDLLRRFLAAGRPVLGVCLGGQLLAKAADAWVGPASEPEIGWYPVDLTPAAASDPLFGSLPRRFDALQWHYYAFDVPAGATELARSPVCSQAFRLGELAWGVQFHPEVTLAMVEGWLEEPEEVPLDREQLRRETLARIEQWNALGRQLCASFVAVAERLRLAA